MLDKKDRMRGFHDSHIFAIDMEYYGLKFSQEFGYQIIEILQGRLHLF